MSEKLLQIHIPKTGGMSIQRCCKINNIPLINYGHAFASTISNIDNFFSFSIVRNPYDRFLSSYYFYKHSKLGTEEVKNAIQGYNTFEEFCLGFKNFKYNSDTQYIKQKDFVIDEQGKIIVDYIGKFEELEKHWKLICEINGINYKPLPHINSTKHKYFDNEYNNKMKEVVYSLFEEDFKLFKYDK